MAGEIISGIVHLFAVDWRFEIKINAVPGRRDGLGKSGLPYLAWAKQSYCRKLTEAVGLQALYASQRHRT